MLRSVRADHHAVAPRRSAAPALHGGAPTRHGRRRPRGLPALERRRRRDVDRASLGPVRGRGNLRRHDRCRVGGRARHGPLRRQRLRGHELVVAVDRPDVLDRARAAWCPGDRVPLDHGDPRRDAAGRGDRLGHRRAALVSERRRRCLLRADRSAGSADPGMGARRGRRLAAGDDRTDPRRRLPLGRRPDGSRDAGHGRRAHLGADRSEHGALGRRAHQPQPDRDHRPRSVHGRRDGRFARTTGTASTIWPPASNPVGSSSTCRRT